MTQLIDPRKLVDSDKLSAEHLATELNAGSTRVFNLDRLHRGVLKADVDPEEYLFRHAELHRVIFIKQALRDSTYQTERRDRIGTKLYFAFNEANAFEGGKSIFIGDPGFDSALAFQTGFERGDEPSNYIHDRDIISILDSLPSLDPFLMKDRLLAEGIDPDDRYFRITAEEFLVVREHVMKKFRPIIEFAFAGLDKTAADAHLRSLVQKLWDAKDMEALKPIVKAMELDAHTAPAAFQSWKGVIYYDYRMDRLAQGIKVLASWLGQDAVPLDIVPTSSRKILDEVRDAIRAVLRRRWGGVRQRLDDYNSAYRKLFVEQQSPGPFIAFLSDAPDVFAELGDGLSRLDHSVEVWRSVLDRYGNSRLKFEPLHNMLSLLYRILE